MSQDFTREEFGAPPTDPTPPDPKGQPRGEARFPLPHPQEFVGSANWANRSYPYWHDEAVQYGGRENAERMRLDPVINACMQLRVYPTALLTDHIDPDDDEDQFQVDCAMKAQRVLTGLPQFTFIKRWLLDDGIFKGRSGSWMRWQYVNKRGRNWHMPTGFRPLDGDKLVFAWAENKVGVLVTSAFGAPIERLSSSERGRVYFCTPEEREELLIHEFEPEDASFYNPMRAGSIKGTGLRGKLYWLWVLKSRVWSMGMDWLQWFAKGLTVFYFQSGNDEHYRAIKAWVEAQDGSSSLFIPWLPGPDMQGYKPVERFDASTASPQFIQQLITQYFDDLFKINILGQTLTSGTAPTGLGSGVAQAHQGTFENFVKYDAVALGETLTRDLLVPFYRANFPGVPCGRWVLDVDDPNVQEMIENAEALYRMGAAIPEEDLMQSAGIPLPKTGQTILTNMQPMQPAAVGGLPDGTPVQQTGQGAQPLQLSRITNREWDAIKRAARRGDRRAQHVLLQRMAHPTRALSDR